MISILFDWCTKSKKPFFLFYSRLMIYKTLSLSFPVFYLLNGILILFQRSFRKSLIDKIKLNCYGRMSWIDILVIKNCLKNNYKASDSNNSIKQNTWPTPKKSRWKYSISGLLVLCTALLDRDCRSQSFVLFFLLD